MSLNVFEELREIWNQVPKDERVKDLSFDIRLHKKLLDIFQVGSYYYFIVNVRHSSFDLVSPEVETVLGYEQGQVDLPFYLSCFHSDDMPFFLNFEAAVEKFFKHLSGDKLFNYKVQYDHRIKKADGRYIRVLTQYVIIQHEADDVKTFTVVTDITHLKKELKPVLSFIGLNGEPSFINVDANNLFEVSKPVFTNRERQVLQALTNGLSSLEISQSLNISKLTVDSHRKNMLKKTNAKSTAEIIRMAFDNGWV
jgi:DNA-binding CsgD family transcriptional regulator